MTVLHDDFARTLPELAVPWTAQEAPEPTLLVLNEALAAELGIDPDWLRSTDGLRFLVGNRVPEGATPVAQGYAGHQFGGFVPQLGDGRALLLGEFPDGRDLHLKGSGRTPFARGGDGLAAVGPMLREFVVSEAMHALGIPTTRSLAVVATGRPVQRDTVLPGAVLARVASSHLRVGTFQYAARDAAVLARLVDYALTRHYPAADRANPALALLDSVIAAQASLIAQWMSVGFVHGVMNTDNMTISGETIDYGPCAFLDTYDPAAVFSSIDRQGRYAFGNQPAVAQWNLARFAETLLPLIDENTDTSIELATEALSRFALRYRSEFEALMKAKLDLADPEPSVDEVLGAMAADRVDFTRALRSANPANPLYIPRNHLVEEALTAATAGDLEPLGILLGAVTDPFTERPGLSRYAQPAPADFGVYTTYCGT